MTTGDKGKLFILSVPLFTLSLLSKIVCSLWYTPGKQMRFDCLLGVSINRACTNDKSNPKALSTLIRFQTKTELFCSVFKKICVHTYRFRILFARPYYNAVSVENAVIPSVRMVKWTRRLRISIYRPAKLAPNWSHMVASVRHLGYSRSSGLAPGRVYFDDVTVFR